MTHCRSCGAPLSLSLVDLGSLPLANAYLPPERANSPEPRIPLHVKVCESCFLVQLADTVPPDQLFSEYAYFSSFSSSWLEHGRRFADEMISGLKLDRHSLVVEVASNDGYLLQHFQSSGIPVLGIEPAGNVADVAIAKGIDTKKAFFSNAYARNLAAQGVKADLLIGNNVLAHVPEIVDFVSGLAAILAKDGTISLEFPHLMPFIDKVEFDTIYHEHVFYFSLLALDPLFRRCGLRIFDAQQLPTHGGSLRILAGHASSAPPDTEAKATILAAERSRGLDNPQAYTQFKAKVEHSRASLRAFLDEAARACKTVAAYGAAAKGNTLLGFCGIGPDRIAMVADRNPVKQGKLLPGSHIPVVAPERIAEVKPDYLLILPWNLADEIIEQMAHIRDWGGRFVLPIPETTVIP